MERPCLPLAVFFLASGSGCLRLDPGRGSGGGLCWRATRRGIPGWNASHRGAGGRSQWLSGSSGRFIPSCLGKLKVTTALRPADPSDPVRSPPGCGSRAPSAGAFGCSTRRVEALIRLGTSFVWPCSRRVFSAAVCLSLGKARDPFAPGFGRRELPADDRFGHVTVV
jgi:hypothetical protein